MANGFNQRDVVSRIETVNPQFDGSEARFPEPDNLVCALPGIMNFARRRVDFCTAAC